MVVHNRQVPEYVGTQLTTTQQIAGCKELLFNGQKISPEIFKQMPQDSYLRRLPLRKVVAGYTKKMDLSTDRTVAYLTGRQQALTDKLWNTLEEAGGSLTIDELTKRMKSGK